MKTVASILSAVLLVAALVWLVVAIVHDGGLTAGTVTAACLLAIGLNTWNPPALK